MKPCSVSFGIGRRAGDHRDAGLVVDGRGGDRHAGVQMADDAGDLRIHELLRDRRAELRVGLVVLAHELELDGLAADLHLLRGRFLDREAGAVLVVLAEVRDAAGERAGVTDLHGDRVVGGRRRGAGAVVRLRRFRLLGLFLAATVHGDERGRDERQADPVEVHA